MINSFQFICLEGGQAKVFGSGIVGMRSGDLKVFKGHLSGRAATFSAAFLQPGHAIGGRMWRRGEKRRGGVGVAVCLNIPRYTFYISVPESKCVCASVARKFMLSSFSTRKVESRSGGNSTN